MTGTKAERAAAQRIAEALNIVGQMAKMLHLLTRAEKRRFIDAARRISGLDVPFEETIPVVEALVALAQRRC